MRKKSVGSSNDRSKTSSQTAYQRASQRDGSPHYVFLYSDDESSGAEEDVPLARIRANRSPPHKIEVIKVLLKADDTLQALALKYNCTTSELKRINHIHKDNEIFARRHVDVPVKPFSVITENLIDYEGTTTTVDNGSLVKTPSEASISKEDKLIAPLKIPASAGNHGDASNPSRDLSSDVANRESVEFTRTIDGENLFTVNFRKLTSAPHRTTAIDWFSCSGADWGLSWTHLLGFSLCLGFAVPLIYIFYIAEKTPDKDVHKINAFNGASSNDRSITIIFTNLVCLLFLSFR